MRLLFFARAARILAASALVVAASAAVVWPLWALATRSRVLYTGLVGAGAVAAFLRARLSRGARSRRRPGGRDGDRLAGPR